MDKDFDAELAKQTSFTFYTEKNWRNLTLYTLREPGLNENTFPNNSILSTRYPDWKTYISFNADIQIRKFKPIETVDIARFLFVSGKTGETVYLELCGYMLGKTNMYFTTGVALGENDEPSRTLTLFGNWVDCKERPNYLALSEDSWMYGLRYDEPVTWFAFVILFGVYFGLFYNKHTKLYSN